MRQPEDWYRFTPHQSITAFEVAKILAASNLALRGDLVSSDMGLHFTKIEPAVVQTTAGNTRGVENG
jgi:hypothetical protein